MRYNAYRGSITANPGIGNPDLYFNGGTLTIEGKVEYFSGSVYVIPEYITCHYHLFQKGKCVWCGQISDEKIEIAANSFPDEKFRNYVNSNFDKDNDGYLTAAEISSVTKIDISNKNISSTNGIEYFTDLQTFLCDDNQLTELDTSNNKNLYVVSCKNNKLKELNVSKNIVLRELNCSNNKLTRLDIRNNTALKWLDCSKNQLTKLDVSSNTALQLLRCEYNLLTALNVSNNSALEYLNCDYNQIKELDTSNNPALENLMCNNNQLTELDISKNT